MLPQVIFINDSSKPSDNLPLQVAPDLPTPSCTDFAPEQTKLDHGIFQERRELVLRYLKDLPVDKVFQNHCLEAGIRNDTPVTGLHQGWEEPHCQLRGHFAGHWLSAVASFARADADALLRARLAEAVSLLAECQARNGGQWAGSIPEKYFGFMERGIPVWSPQYTVHKTLAGLLDAWRLGGSQAARDILLAWAGWFHAWAGRLVEGGQSGVIYQGECAGMLELWADLYQLTRDPRHLELAGWYAAPDLFQRLLDGEDPLSHSHANASIPWILGAARLYEVCGDPRYRAVVEAFWRQAVDSRGMFASGGANAGEYWIPRDGFERFLGDRTQEHCTVYNMIRVAQALFRWTGEARYASYIERALYNGILAQQHRHNGMVSYFLPLSPGARKQWGRPTQDFWCCHGTLVQAHALHGSLIYHARQGGISVDQYIPSRLDSGDGIALHLVREWQPDQVDAAWDLRLTVTSSRDEPWPLWLRLPDWLAAPAEVWLDGAAVRPDQVGGYLVLQVGAARADIRLRFPKALRRESLPVSSGRFALLDGPVVLAALTEQEAVLAGEIRTLPLQEHQYVGGREWQTGHCLLPLADRSLRLMPLHEVTDERYTVYFRSC